MEAEHSHRHHRRLKEEQIYRLREQASRDRRRRLWMAAASSLIALAGALLSFSSFTKIATKRENINIADLNSHPAIVSVEEKIKKLNDSLDEVRANLEAIKAPVPESALASKQAELASQVGLVDTRLSALEAALQESPERALSIPLLRKDLGELNSRSQEYRALSKSEFDRIYAHQTWILGGIGTVLFAVAGGSVTILIRSLPRPIEQNQTESGSDGNG